MDVTKLRKFIWSGDIHSPTPYDLQVLNMIFNFVLGPPSPGGSRGRVRTAIFLGKS